MFMYFYNFFQNLYLPYFMLFSQMRMFPKGGFQLTPGYKFAPKIWLHRYKHTKYTHLSRKTSKTAQKQMERSITQTGLKLVVTLCFREERGHQYD